MPKAAKSKHSRILHVHLVPSLVSAKQLAGGIAIVVDVLRATTTIVRALTVGVTSVRVCAEIAEAKLLANSLKPAKVILAGERGGKKIPGFDRGNSPLEFTASNCKNATLVMTTTNGTAALLHAASAERVLVGAFVNFSAVCEQLRQDVRPIHVICAGTDGEPSFEDTLFAGGLVECLCDDYELELNDSARLAWNSFETHGHVLEQSMKLGRGGSNLIELGFEDDIAAAAQIDEYVIVPELKRDPLRIEVGGVGVVKKQWPK